MPQFRNVTSDGEEPGCEEGMETIDNPHVEIRMLGTPSDGRSVRKNRSSWRSLDRSAVAVSAPVKFRISCRVGTASPPMPSTTKPGKMRSF